MAQQPSDWATDALCDRQLGDLANWSHQFIDLILAKDTADALAAQGWSASETDLLRAKLIRLEDCVKKARGWDVAFLPT
jgi:hypothetical protein